MKMEQIEEEPPSSIDFVLLGKTGSGKSAAGNTLLGRNAFTSKKSPTSVTREVQVEHGTFNGLRITVYDTPGFFDTKLSEQQIKEKCQSVLNACESHQCVYLLVMKADRFTSEERRTVEKIEAFLGQNRLEKTWILFTRGDELEHENQTIKEFISGTPELQKLVKKYQDRYHVFNNMKKKITSQVRCLLKKIFQRTNPFRSKFKRKQTEAISSSGSERRLVLLGKSGVGKSASGNLILGQKYFKSKLGMESVTKECEVKTAGGKVSVVDTPGLFDTVLTHEQMMKEIARCMCLSSPGPHAFLIALPLTGRFTEQEQEVIENIKLIFGEEVLKYTIILFTHGDELRGGKIEELIEESHDLRELVQQCGGYHVFNNKQMNNREQVTQLLEKIDRMVELNGGGCFSNELFDKAERYQKEEEDRIQREEEQKQQETERVITTDESEKKMQKQGSQTTKNEKEQTLHKESVTQSQQIEEGQTDDNPENKGCLSWFWEKICFWLLRVLRITDCIKWCQS